MFFPHSNALSSSFIESNPTLLGQQNDSQQCNWVLENECYYSKQDHTLCFLRSNFSIANPRSEIVKSESEGAYHFKLLVFGGIGAISFKLLKGPRKIGDETKSYVLPTGTIQTLARPDRGFLFHSDEIPAIRNYTNKATLFADKF
jgi:hypothetical protein